MRVYETDIKINSNTVFESTTPHRVLLKVTLKEGIPDIDRFIKGQVFTAFSLDRESALKSLVSAIYAKGLYSTLDVY